MKPIKGLPLELAEKMELPRELLPGTAGISIIGGRQACVEGHRGILEYSEERIVLALRKGRIIINGSSLKIEAMNAGELLLAGRIESVEWQ